MTKIIIENLLDLLKLQIEQLKSENQMLKEQNEVILKTLSLHNVEVDYKKRLNEDAMAKENTFQVVDKNANRKTAADRVG